VIWTRVFRIRALLARCGFAVAISFALARVHPFGDAELYLRKSAETPILRSSAEPDAARTILLEKCADCHSNQTNAPFYGHFAPASWLMERDIVRARRAMNLSLWERYSADQQQTLLARIVHETKSREMPPLQYRMIHRNARITDADLTALDQLVRAPDTIQTGSPPAGEGDPVRGKELFEKRCVGCHALTQNREGPKLQGVYGRTSGTAEYFVYSAALKKAQIVWDTTSLNRWLADPDAFVPGNDMDFLVSRPQERLDLISYLKQSSGK
jgi:cytochrome c